MAAMTVPAVNIRQAVLEALRNNERQPMQLLTDLGQLGYADSEIKRAVSELIHEGQIQLTPHRMLKIPAERAA
jgi:hypothetical protein